MSVELMPIDRQLGLAAITMSAESDAIDVVSLNDSAFKRVAASGWLAPLDDLWEKCEEKYNLDDFPPSVIDSVSYEGKIDSMPIPTNTMMFFYPDDLFEAAGIAPPETMEEYTAAAAEFDSARRARKAPTSSSTSTSGATSSPPTSTGGWTLRAGRPSA